MKKGLFIIIALLLLAACGGNEDSDYTTVEQEVNTDGGKSTVRLYTEDTSEENIEAIIDELMQEDFFGTESLHAWVHEPADDEYGALIATAKYANGNKGKAQVGVDELGETFIEFE